MIWRSAKVPAVRSGACPKEAAVVVISLSVSDRMVQMLTGRSVLTLSTPHVPGFRRLMRMPATVPRIINVPILIKYFSVSRALAGTSQKHLVHLYLNFLNSCRWEEEDAEPPLNCFYKRDCIELDGMYSCNDGLCSRLNNWECERFRVDIPTYDDSIVSMAGDTIISSSCRRAINVRTGEKIWDILDHPDTVLLSSCTSLEITEDNLIRGKDCINGTTMPVQLFDDFTNFTTLMNLFQKQGQKYKLDQPDKVSGLPRGTHIPFDTDIKIFNKSMLNINHEGCVNTLQFECTEFYAIHGQDSRNGSSPARFPCFYSPHNPEFVVRRYDLVTTKTIFLMFFTIPSACFFSSCLVLFVCSQLVGVQRTGNMAIMPACCGGSGRESSVDHQDDVDMKILGQDHEST